MRIFTFYFIVFNNDEVYHSYKVFNFFCLDFKIQVISEVDGSTHKGGM